MEFKAEPLKPNFINGKLYLSADQLMIDSFMLAKKIWDSGYRPDYIVALWRGGTPPGMVIHEYFRYRGLEAYHTAIKTQSYQGLVRGGKTEIKGMEHVIEIIDADDHMLIVDDVFDTGITVREVLKYIRKKARRNTPNIKVATIYFKKAKNTTSLVPDYFLKINNNWIVFPHELDGLTEDEIKNKAPEIYEIVCNNCYPKHFAIDDCAEL